MTTAALATTYVTCDVTPRSWRTRYPGDRLTTWWLERDGVVVAYMKTHTYPDEQFSGVRFVMNEIEVREGHRGTGLVAELIAHAQAATGFVLHSTGGFTPKGAAALMGRLPVVPGNESGVMYSDMTFVENWDARLPRYR